MGSVVTSSGTVILLNMAPQKFDATAPSLLPENPYISPNTNKIVLIDLLNNAEQKFLAP